jgi:hypothetical protein
MPRPWWRCRWPVTRAGKKLGAMAGDWCIVIGLCFDVMRTAFFAPKTLSNLPADNLEGLAALCTEFERFDGHARQLPEHHDDYVEALSILRAFAAARGATLAPWPEIGTQRHQNVANINMYFGKLRDQVRADLVGRHSRGYFETKTEEYMTLFSKAAIYEFTDTEFKRIHQLLHELRDLIQTSNLIPETQQRRLLRRLEATRAELHKKTNDIDRFWGFLGEAGIAMRKFGEDFGPISDRVIELAEVVLGVVRNREGIKALPELNDILQGRAA